MRYIILTLIVFCTYTAMAMGIFSPEDVNTREKAVAAVHQLMKARYDFHKDYIDYLKDEAIPEKEKLDLISEYSGTDKSQIFPGLIGLSLAGLKEDLNHFERVSNLSRDPRLLTVLHLELSFVKRMGLLGAEEKMKFQQDAKEHKRTGNTKDVLQYRGFSSEYNDAPCQEESLKYLSPFLTEAHRNFEKKMRSRETKAKIGAFGEPAQCTLNINDLMYLYEEATQITTVKIKAKLEALQPSIGKERGHFLWEQSMKFFNEASGHFLEPQIPILKFGRSLEALHNQEKILDILITRNIRPLLPSPMSTAALVTIPTASKPLALPTIPAAVADAPESLVQKPLPESTPEPVSLPEEQLPERHFRQWTQEEKAEVQAQPMAAAASLPIIETRADLSDVIKTLMGKAQLDFFREVVPQILNPILKNDLVMDINKHNINLFIPHKSNPDQRELIYFHVPHGKNVKASHHAFWRHQIKKALTAAGWI